jgi:hypothetical protein
MYHQSSTTRNSTNGFQPDALRQENVSKCREQAKWEYYNADFEAKKEIPTDLSKSSVKTIPLLFETGPAIKEVQSFNERSLCPWNGSDF